MPEPAFVTPQKFAAGAHYSYCEVVNYLLVTYATDNVISEAMHDISSCTQAHIATSVSYAQTVWDESLRATLYMPKRH